MGKRNKNFRRHHNKPYNKPHNKPFNKPYNKNQRFQKSTNENPPICPMQNEEDNIIKESLKEDQVGITEYVNRGEGFKGIIKSRFSDFHVNEIDIQGRILHLTDLTIPEQVEEELNPEELCSAKELLKDVVTEDMWKQIKDLSESKLEQHKKPKDHNITFDVTQMDREQRTKFHKFIGTVYKNKLISRTLKGAQVTDMDPEKRFVSVMKAARGGPTRNRWTFPGEIVHFLVHKENLDTSDVASTIASRLHLRPSFVNYCGTKDKRAKTTQKFCIKRRTPQQIAGTVKFMNGVKLGNFHFKSRYSTLGDLRGNRFRIAIRNLIGDREHIETSLKNVKEQGFINYFGFQRFGNCSSIPTYEIGIALLKADYKLACELILKPRDNDVPFLKKIREMWWKNRDSKAAAAEFYSDRFIEKKLLDGLAQYGEHDYAAALMKIPRNMLLLYPHAFQSLIFNYVASKRIKEFGLSVLPGDLVYVHKDTLRELFEAEQEKLKNESNKNSENNERNENKESNENNENKESNENNESNDKNEEQTEFEIKDEINDEDQEEEIENQEEFMDEKDANSENPTTTRRKDRPRFIFKRMVKFLTEEEIANATYTIHDVLLTLPGHDVLYPQNVIGTYYKEFIEKYDLSSENFKHNLKTFAMKGAYRKLVVAPRDMSWEFKSYSSPDETLILSDLEVLEGKTLDDFKTPGVEPKYEALLLDFCLPPASYATMMLRELLKCDTSAAAQSILQKEANKEHADAGDVEKETTQAEALGEKRQADDSENAEDPIQPAKLPKNE